MLHNKQHQPPKGPPPKPKREPRHWNQQIQETVASSVHGESLCIELKGGADSGQFVYLGNVDHDKISYHGEKLYGDDILLEVQGQKVSGYTLRDATVWLKQVSQNGAPVMIKTVRPGALTKDLRQYLATRFPKGSVDHDLQQTIRDNLYMRTVPCTTRAPRPGETNGVDYNFLTLEEFAVLEKSGELLESGIFDGNHYGTPKPPKEPTAPLVRRSNSTAAGLPGSSSGAPARFPPQRKRSQSGSDLPPSTDTFEDEYVQPFTRKKSLERAHSASNLGPLPPNWEMAFTDDGHPYFIDHATETTHWLDPRLAHLQKQGAHECEEDELPFGWEKVEDPHYGTYYIDHVNRRTQYENPVASAKKDEGEDMNGMSAYPRTAKQLSDLSSKRSVSDNSMNNANGPIIKPEVKKPFFTKNPGELQGEFVKTTLVKSVRGFGFTIIGGDHADEEFLQIKNVVPDGPAFHNGKLKTGDVIVFVNNTCVLGYTHQDVVSLFQTIPPHETVTLEICRGYPLPFDPDDPNTEIVTTVAVNLPQDGQGSGPGSVSGSGPPFSGLVGTDLNSSNRSLRSLPDLARSANTNSNMSFSQHSVPGDLKPVSHGSNGPPDLVSAATSKAEILTVNIVRGPMGFGFTIADSPYGQKVKQILDKPRCKTLLEGDLLQEINGIDVRQMTHAQIVQVLKDCPIGTETQIIVQRGGLPLHSKKKMKTSQSFDDRPQLNNNLGAPGAYFFTGSDSNLRNVDSSLPALSKLDDSLASVNEEPPLPPPPPELTASGEDSTGPLDKGDIMDGPLPPAPAADGDDADSARSHHKDSRPKTPSSSSNIEAPRPKTPQNRPKTPTAHGYGDPRSNRPAYDSRGMFMDSQNVRSPVENHVSKYPEEVPNQNDYGHSRSDTNNVESLYERARPPTGPRMDPFRHNDVRLDSRGRPDYQDGYGFGRANHVGGGEDRYGYAREAKPGQFRSRTPGPEMMARGGVGPDYRPETHRPKTPTAQDMRSKTPMPTSHAYNSGEFRASGRYTPNPNMEFGRYGRTMDHSRGWPDFSSPPVGRRFDSFENPAHNRSYGGELARTMGPAASSSGQNSPRGAGHPVRQSTSFETQEPMPSNLTRMPKRNAQQGFPPAPGPGSAGHSPRSTSRGPVDQGDGGGVVEFTVQLHRQESGYGFRIIGGTEEGSQVSVGHIVPGGSADLDGRLRKNDEIIHVDGQSVIGSSHHRVVQLMTNAALNGRVTLGVRRRLQPFPDVTANSHGVTYPYEVTVSRRETEGFGFVIISSVTKSGSTLGEFIDGKDGVREKGHVCPWIGRIIENSPAERCGQLHIGDRIMAVNGVDITHMHHEDIVNLIKESGYTVVLTIGPPLADDASSTTSQRSSQGSMVNAMAYPAGPDSDSQRRPDLSPHHPAWDRGNSSTVPGLSRGRLTSHPGPEEGELYTVELHRGSRGFGFSIRGGREFNNMPLFVLRIAEGGAADLDGRLRVGDQILQINNVTTDSMTHTEAIDIIQSGGSSVHLLMKRTGKPPPAFEGAQTPSPLSRYPPPLSNGPIGHSSPHLGRRQMDREDYFHGYPHGRSFHNY